MTREERHRVINADCRDAMRAMDAESVDAIVTDPPYGLSFMGREWDHGVPGVEFWREALRVAKPGAHLVAFGGTRTFHRLTCAIEDAGWEVRDCLSWLYGSGFSKSLNVSKAIDRQRHDSADIYRVTAWLREARDAAGMTNAQIDAAFGFAGMAGHWTSAKSQPSVPTIDQVPMLLDVLRVAPEDVPEDIHRLLWDLNERKGQPGENWAKRESSGWYDSPAAAQMWLRNYGGQNIPTAKERKDNPATDDARTWQGWGTALKPAWEPVILARKPLVGTVASNVLAHGTGALNIDGCRIGLTKRVPGTPKRADASSHTVSLPGYDGGTRHDPNVGRWPANVALDEEAAAMLDAQTGTLTSGSRAAEKYGLMGFRGHGSVAMPAVAGDSGGASRFFYTAKAASDERGAGNTHPTVKPVALMRWLVRMVTPPGGLVLDPFCGSGSTLVAASLEGFSAVGIEREPEYAAIARGRIYDSNPMGL
jgi:predicted RNA methylase